MVGAEARLAGGGAAAVRGTVEELGAGLAVGEGPVADAIDATLGRTVCGVGARIAVELTCAGGAKAVDAFGRLTVSRALAGHTVGQLVVADLDSLTFGSQERATKPRYAAGLGRRTGSRIERAAGVCLTRAARNIDTRKVFSPPARARVPAQSGAFGVLHAFGDGAAAVAVVDAGGGRHDVV